MTNIVLDMKYQHCLINQRGTFAFGYCCPTRILWAHVVLHPRQWQSSNICTDSKYAFSVARDLKCCRSNGFSYLN